MTNDTHLPYQEEYELQTTAQIKELPKIEAPSEFRCSVTRITHNKVG